MTFEDYADFIADLLEYGDITAAEAEELLSRYEEFVDIELPLRPEILGQKGIFTEAISTAVIMSLLYSALNRSADRASIGKALQDLSRAQKVSAFNSVQKLFTRNTEELTKNLVSGEISIVDWQESMSDALSGYLVSVAKIASAQQTLPQDIEQQLTSKAQEQLAYLSRFSDQYILSKLRGNEWSEQYLINRSAQYAGVFRAFGFVVLEETSYADYGWVHVYVAKDDGRTCSECVAAAANSPYLSGQGPFPGQDCLGKERCRCERFPVYNPEVYERLIAGEQR